MNTNWNYVPIDYTVQPNSYYYLIGLLANTLLLIIVIYHFFILYIKSSKYFVHTAPLDFKKIIKKYDLKTVDNKFIEEYFWPFICKVLIIEILFFTFLNFFFSISFLTLSIILLLISFFISFFNFFIFGYYLARFDEIALIIKIRTARINDLEQEYVKIREFFKTKNLFTPGVFDDSTIDLEIEKLKKLKSAAIDQQLFGNQSWSWDTIDPISAEAEQHESNFREWVEQSGNTEIFSFCYYIYYLLFACKDSPYLYETIWPILFEQPKNWQYQFKTKPSIDYNSLLEEAIKIDNTMKHIPQLENIEEVCILTSDFLTHVGGWF